MAKYLKLDISSMFDPSNQYYTTYDVGFTNGSITIHSDDKEAFLREFALIWREMAEDGLVEIDENRDHYGDIIKEDRFDD
ncbi:hypothetical protein M2277_004983 [Paenibacillus sp. LBL]|uniref:hypothetical protein n=1 Tax=Paenibacillus sp. LBL TaxID=2940563 RepID=UPI0024737B22|nr:hypothetical protein [Paenibacillus sp. LBL]MDH6674291.1 hypothetical protein [Paenibacillus sp. LBL]